MENKGKFPSSHNNKIIASPQVECKSGDINYKKRHIQIEVKKQWKFIDSFVYTS